MAIAPERTSIGIRRHFTEDGTHPFDTLTWERRDARVTNYRDGAVTFEQLGVEVPSTWSVNATNILAQKYFRGGLGTSGRESSLRQVVDRITDTITAWGLEDGYFSDADEAAAFSDELKYLMVHQRAAFNSPVWFNIGVEGVPRQASACFILAVEDKMASILNWYVEEGTIFKGGSGSGVNLSPIRSSKESLRGGGTASGPVSFMRGADASAGTIRSGGKTRRAAKMVILNADHPDIEDFIWCKAAEERKARALRDAGFDMDLDGRDSHSIQYQNANNSVRVTDEFMHAVVDDVDWDLKAVTTGEVVRTVKAKELFRQIAQAAWECADPGIQFDTTINTWNTAANTGRINGSNPCFTGDTLVETDDGPVTFELLHKAHEAGQKLPHVPSVDLPGIVVHRPVTRVWVSGHTRRLVEVRTAKGLKLRCTPEHRFLTAATQWVEAGHLTPGTQLWGLGPDDTQPDDRVLSVEEVELDEEVPVYDLEVAGTHNFAITSIPTWVPPGHELVARHGVVVHNCSEYMHLDNSACNLASLNLVRYLDDDDAFDVEGFKATVEVMVTAMEILVGRADYPTEQIAETAHRFRQLGLGYANLGAALMAQGLPYDSDGGRAWGAAVTSLLTGHAYATSARLAARMGAFAGYEENREPMQLVLEMHGVAAHKIDPDLAPADVLEAAHQSWDEAVEGCRDHGVRNSQASLAAPTGTISFVLDCDTTGIEPDLGLVKTKKLVGGGSMSIVNQTVPRALRRLGYDDTQVGQIVAHVAEHYSIVGAPGLEAEHLPVFACSMGDNVIHHSGHVRMMAALQPAWSGAQSKTCNLPEEATVEDVEQLYLDAWRMGIKALAIYRDNCKVGQPLSATKAAPASEAEAHDQEMAAKLADLEQRLEIQTVLVNQPVRERLPRRRRSNTFSFRVADCEGYTTVGEYDDGRPGELFIKVSKQGSTLSGVMDAFAISVSLGLQHRVPLSTYVSKYTNMRFEPSGWTDDPELKIAASLVDYIFRRLAVDYLPVTERAELGILTVAERTQPTLPGVEEVAVVDAPVVVPVRSGEPVAAVAPASTSNGSTPVSAERDAPFCYQCGNSMQRAGSCFVCPSCGTTSGCS